MSWAVGYDHHCKRDIGYGVPATCDMPECGNEIDRGLSFVCRDQVPHGGERGCGLFFCELHLGWGQRCPKSHRHLEPTPDLPKWMRWKLRDESWARWREQSPDHVAAIRVALRAAKGGTSQ